MIGAIIASLVGYLAMSASVASAALSPVPGSTEGSFSISPDGAATYAIPIKVPPGTAGMEPKIALSYNSRGGASPVGFGWAIAGLSSVQRGPRNLGEDGIVRGVQLDEGDALFLDGEKLVQVAANEDGGYREFRTRVDNYSRVRAYEWDGSGPKRLTVETRAGLKMYFGSKESSRVILPTSKKILSWLCDRIEDSVGNYMVFFYVFDGLDHKIKEISYTGNDAAKLQPYAKVEFLYEKIAPYELRYILGDRVEPSFQLRTIVTKFKDKVHRRYSLKHEPIDSIRKVQRLVELEEAGHDGLAFRPLQFKYSEAKGNWEPIEIAAFPVPQEIAEWKDVIGGMAFLNIKGDAKPELLYSYFANGAEKKGAYEYDPAAPASKNGWKPLGTEFLPPVILGQLTPRTPEEVRKGLAIHDINGDGYQDIILSNDTEVERVYLGGDKGWSDVPEASLIFKFEMGGRRDNRFLWIDVDPNKKDGDELLWASSDQQTPFGAAKFDGKKWQAVNAFKPPKVFESDGSGFLNGTYAIDVDCDGKKELVYNLLRKDGTKLQEVRRSTTKWEAHDQKDDIFKLPFEPVPHSGAVRVEDLNGDGCKDVVVAYESDGRKVREAWIANAQDGWQPDSRQIPDIVFWSGSKGSKGELLAELGDLDGDQRADIVFNNDTDGVGAYRGMQTEWKPASTFAPPEPLDSRPEGRPYQYSIVPLKGAGGPQWVYHTSQRDPGKLLPKIYSHTANGWKIDQDVRIPLNIAQFDRADLGIRFPDLNGDGYADIAFTKNKQGTRFETQVAYVFRPGNRNPWVSEDKYKIPVATFSDDMKDTGTFLVDFSGDGITDVLQSYQKTDGSLEKSAHVNCTFKDKRCKDVLDPNSHWVKVATNTPDLVDYIPPVAFAQEGVGSLGVRPIDINGDGLTDLVLARDERVQLKDQPVRAVYLNTGRGWSKESLEQLHLPVSFVRPGEHGTPSDPTVDNRVELIDLNGDRLPDILYHARVRVFESLTEADKKDWGESGVPPVRKSELREEKKAFLNRGDRWEEAPLYAPPLRFDEDPNAPNRKYFFEDVNGDGQVDLLYADRTGNSNKSATYLNTGAGWTKNPVAEYQLPIDALVDPISGDAGFRFLDLNADGLVDVGFHRVPTDGNPIKRAYLNTGSGWKQADEYAPPLPFYEDGRVDLGVRPLDLNGDGVVDLAQTYKRANDNTVNTVWLNKPFKDGTTKTDLLIDVQTGLGMKSHVEYRSLIGIEFDGDKLTQERRYEGEGSRNPSYPVIDPPLPGYVVTEVATDGQGVLGRSSRYRYGQYRVNTLTGKSLGFGFQEIEDVERRRLTKIRFLQKDGLIGSIASTEIRQGQRVQPISSTNADHVTLSRPGTSLGNGFQPAILQTHLIKGSVISRDLEGLLLSSQTDTFTYDNYGNPKVVRTEFGDGSGSETTNFYQDDLGRWHLGRLSKSEVKLFAPNQKEQVRTATFGYDPRTGQLTNEVSLVGTEFEVATNYLRDVYGNKTASTVNVKTGEAPRRVRVEYDGLGRFPISTINQLGHTSRVEFDDVSGGVTARIDPNSIRVYYVFDSLNRLRKEVGPSGLVTGTEARFDNSIPNIVFSVTKQTDGLPPTTTMHDAAGRPRLESSVGFGGKPVLVDYEYDRLGRLFQSSLPRFKGEQVHYTTRSYDDLDRVIREQQPDESMVKTEFKGLQTVVTDPLDRTTLIEKDLRGRTIKTTDPLKGETQFYYDVAGKNVRIVNALGQETKVHYDLAGQRIGLDDPAMGVWGYKYNGFSELVAQTDPRGERVDLVYDEIGRLVRRESSGGAAAYFYDEVKTREGAVERFLGQLLRVSSSEGAQRDVRYDEYGRVKSLQFRVGLYASSTTVAYDDQSRPVNRIYSTGFQVLNHYDENGFWRKVEVAKGHEKDAQAIWEALEIDAVGRTIREQLGNGVTNGYSFNDKNGRLEGSSSTAHGNLKLQDMSFEYDLAGNVLKRTDLLQTRTEQYEYDDLNRLVQSTGLPSGNINVSYDGLGNVLTKSDVGAYRYCERTAGRHQLCEVESKKGLRTKLSYDQAGNMVQLGDQVVTYDSDGRVASLREGRFNHSEFTYGADGELIYQSSRYYLNNFATTYFGDTELIREEFTPPLFPTPERTRLRHFVSTPTGTIGFLEFTYLHFPYRHTSPILNTLITGNPLRTTEVVAGMTYFLKDHLGSIRAILNDKGDLTERLDYDPWGKRVQSSDYVYHTVKQGFTGHEHLDNFGLVHMGGRVYSPSLARFISPDPFVQFPGYSQSHNRYAYVLNNPLRFIDPTGFFLGGIVRAIGNAIAAVGDAIKNVVDAVIGKPLRWVGEQLHKAGRWLQENWRTVAVIAATIALGPAGSVFTAFLTGAAIGGFSAALYGGSFNDVLRGALIGGVSAAAFSYVGGMNLSSLEASTAHGLVGGMSSVMQGQDFGSGFLSAFVTRAAAPNINQLSTTGSRVAAAALLGGITASIGGNSFENGAITAAFSRMYGEERREGVFDRLVAKAKVKLNELRSSLPQMAVDAVDPFPLSDAGLGDASTPEGGKLNVKVSVLGSQDKDLIKSWISDHRTLVEGVAVAGAAGTFLQSGISLSNIPISHTYNLSAGATLNVGVNVSAGAIGPRLDFSSVHEPRVTGGYIQFKYSW